MTIKQARRLAQRAAQAEYCRRMQDSDAPGRASEREDSAQYSARLAGGAKMTEWGYGLAAIARTIRVSGWDMEL